MTDGIEEITPLEDRGLISRIIRLMNIAHIRFAIMLRLQLHPILHLISFAASMCLPDTRRYLYRTGS
jgi:hypothetical protein